ncbi:hypothetical protein J6590_059914 [Homalodisca vitripennis]|nr:hypothetical protein J6590_059914 [Homalodisca vitripennis]
MEEELEARRILLHLRHHHIAVGRHDLAARPTYYTSAAPQAPSHRCGASLTISNTRVDCLTHYLLHKRQIRKPHWNTVHSTIWRPDLRTTLLLHLGHHHIAVGRV